MKDKIFAINLANKIGYSTNKDGELVNPKGKILKGYISTTGYKRFNIRWGNKFLYVMFHRLQAFQKYGQSIFEEGIVTRHLDGNCLNNSYDNISIGSHSDNMMDKPKELRVSQAIHASSFKKKYNNQKIIDYYNKCKSYKKTKEKFGITSNGTLHYILNPKY